MTADVRQDKPALSEPWICRRCTGARGAHYLTCPTLQLAPPARAEAG